MLMQILLDYGPMKMFKILHESKVAQDIDLHSKLSSDLGQNFKAGIRYHSQFVILYLSI